MGGLPPRGFVVEDALAEREAGATDVHHVIEVVDNFVYFAVVVSCVVCHLFTKITRLVFKCLSPFVVRVILPSQND